jgi:drug/metabolite transporter (DMT)-like permease
LAAQQAMSLVFCMFAKRFLSDVKGFEVPDVKRPLLAAAAWPGLLNVANIVVGWYGMALVNIPLFLCVRRTATAMVLVTEYLIRGKVENAETQVSVALIVGGAVVAGWETILKVRGPLSPTPLVCSPFLARFSLKFSPFSHPPPPSRHPQGDSLGLLYTMLNNVLTAWSHTESKRFADKFNCHGFGIVLYNAVTALPLTLVGAVALGEWHYTFTTFEQRHNPQFWGSVAVASFMGVIITYIVFLCTTVNGPLVTSITGNAKDVLQTMLGAVLFHDFVPTVQNVAGIVMSFCGAGLFTWTKLRDALAAGRREALKKADSAVAPLSPSDGGGRAGGGEPEAPSKP